MARMIRRQFFRRTDFKLLKEESSDEISGLSDLYSSDYTKQFKNSTSQKLYRKNFNKLFAKIVFPLLFKCNFFSPKCFSLIFLFSIYSISVCDLSLMSIYYSRLSFYYSGLFCLF